ncbi:MAG: hypothetical protein IJU66_07675 [Oscillospiraceae bacterium]|nr:hypothetical protein [Oscillospiraceae bacterium]
MTEDAKAAQGARCEVVSVRMTKAEKRRLQKLAREKHESVSGLLMRGAEEAHMLAPREAKGERPVYRFVIGDGNGETPSERPEAHGDASCLELSEEARNYAG